MKYTKTIEIEIEITEQLIADLNELYGEDNDEDFHDLENLESLLDELVFANISYDDIVCKNHEDETYKLIKISENSGLVGIKYPD